MMLARKRVSPWSASAAPRQIARHFELTTSASLAVMSIGALDLVSIWARTAPQAARTTRVAAVARPRSRRLVMGAPLRPTPSWRHGRRAVDARMDPALEDHAIALVIDVVAV